MHVFPMQQGKTKFFFEVGVFKQGDVRVLPSFAGVVG